MEPETRRFPMTQMATLTVQVPAPFLECGLDQRDIDASVSETLALKLFESGRITSGSAARLLGINRLAFLDLLHTHGIPYFDYSREELEKRQETLDSFLSKMPA
jgi:predicted HTH domain antitoxin